MVLQLTRAPEEAFIPAGFGRFATMLTGVGPVGAQGSIDASVRIRQLQRELANVIMERERYRAERDQAMAQLDSVKAEQTKDRTERDATTQRQANESRGSQMAEQRLDDETRAGNRRKGTE